MKTAGTTNRGGFVVMARADLDQVVADIKLASTYVAEHPESNALANGPVANESSALQPGVLLHVAQGQTRAPNSYPPLNGSINNLNAALKFLINNSASDYHGPVLGDIGGIREKIIADIVKTGSDIRSAMDYGDAHPSAAAAARTTTTAPVASGPPAALSGDQLKALVIIEGDSSRGSGFVAKIRDQFYIVTNEHVLSGNKKFTITGMDGTKYPTTGALFGAVGHDAAILKIPAALAKYYLEIEDDPLANAKPGDAVTVPGNEAGAGVAIQINGKVVGVGPDLVEVDAKFVQGNSGSPIIHRATEKVIGMATYAVTYKLSELGKVANVPEIRWFGFRLDNIDPKQWEPMDWARFSDEGLAVEEIVELSRLEIALLSNQKLPASGDAKIMSAVGALRTGVSAAVTRGNQQDYLKTIQAFFQQMRSLAASDVNQLSHYKLYSYHAELVKELQDVRTSIEKTYATEADNFPFMKDSF